MARNNGWTLGVGYNPDGVRMREQRPPDAHCLNCEDEYLGEELVRGWCFPCRLERHLTRKVPLEVRASRGCEVDLIFPTKGVV